MVYMNETLDKRGGEEIRIRNIPNINISNITPTSGINNAIEFSFPYKLYLLKKCSYKIGVLVDAFKQWHHEAPDEDFNNIGGRIAGICKSMNNDYGYILEILWTSVPRSPNGSHLNYIQGIINSKKNGNKNKSSFLSDVGGSEELREKFRNVEVKRFNVDEK
jgi:hypothetical protein